MNTVVILVSGKRCSGKDYVARVLKRELESHGLTVQCEAFGTQVKVEYAKKYGLSIERLCEDRAYKERHRQGLIDYAMAKREQDNGHWADVLWRNLTAQPDVLIITDWRFLVEWDRVRAWPVTTYYTVRVETPKHQRQMWGWFPNVTVDSHISEKDLDYFEGFDFIFNNTGSEENTARKFARDLVQRANLVKSSDESSSSST